jgi:hypothetical protein
MRSFTLMRVVSPAILFLTAMAFSCQDHHTPDPDPAANCQRVDGSDRDFPCEFKITKLEFLRKNTNNVVRTFLPGDSTIGLPVNAADSYGWGSKHAYVWMNYRVRVHVKRIAPASFQPVGGYELVLYPLYIADPDSPYHSLYDDIIGSPFGLQPPPSPAANPLDMSMAVGETRSYVFPLYLFFDTEFRRGRHFPDLLFGVVNNTTALTLIGAPYNYKLFRDLNEARILFIPLVDCEPGAECY